VSTHGKSLHCQESEDAAAYVLGALDEPEFYRQHLATCTVCQAEVARLQPVVDTLPATVPPQSAPEGLRRRVVSVVRAEAELLRVAGAEAAGGADRAGPCSRGARSPRVWLQCSQSRSPQGHLSRHG